MFRFGNLLLLAMLASVCRGALLNSGFDEGLSSWEITGGSNAFSVVEFEGRKVLQGAKGEQDGQRVVARSFAAKPGEAYELTAEICPVGVKGWCGINLHFYNEKGDLVDQTPNWQPSLSSGWSKSVVRSRAPAETVKGAVVFFINGTGKAYWANPKLALLPPVSIKDKADVAITVTEEVTCADFQGFGYEDDGWFYNEHNAKHGVDEADAKIREARIEWMNPDNVGHKARLTSGVNPDATVLN